MASAISAGSEIDQKSGFVVQNEFLRTAATGRHDWATAGHRFKRRYAKSLLMRRNHEHIKRPQFIAQCLHRNISAEFDEVADAELLYPTVQPLIWFAAN